MRWLHALDGPGPEYCRQVCQAHGVPTRCDECPEPELLPENEQAAQLYLSVRTQWRRTGHGVVTGMDYAAVEATMRMLQVPRAGRPELLAQLQVMEGATIEAAVELAKRNGDQN